MNKGQEMYVSEKTGIVEYLFISAVAVFLIYCIYTMYGLFSSF
ncbi:MAG: hypothetical protein U9R21_00980 [Candidatus Thermoplasmatota archaeon]|nr:hypothetical protein [Candidatus Thermoplasmatota archaeon]